MCTMQRVGVPTAGAEHMQSKGDDVGGSNQRRVAAGGDIKNGVIAKACCWHGLPLVIVSNPCICISSRNASSISTNGQPPAAITCKYLP